MSAPNTSAGNSQASSGGAAGNGNQITPELVRQVAEKVYAMLLRDLRIEMERHQPSRRDISGNRGGLR